MKIGILREEKIPHDNRVPLTPSQCEMLLEENPGLEVFVQPCQYRCYTNEEYDYHNIPLKDDLSDCDVLLGVKEIPPQFLIPDKTYFIFSHVIKKQPHNKKLLQTVLEKNIRLIDWETLTDEKGKRLIAFGRWAGIVGAYHAVRMVGIATKRFYLKQMSECHNFAETQREFEKLNLPKIKILLTGTGRVSAGANFLLRIMGIKKVSAKDFLYQQFDECVYTQLTSKDMYYKEGADEFDTTDFHLNPQEYKSCFFPFTRAADVMINGIYWDKRYPVFFTKEQMKEKDFRIKQIADITCDIAPASSVPSTLKSSSIENPYYGYDAQNEKIVEPFLPDPIIDVMAIDNLPNELPRDASEDFGNIFLSRILPEIKKPDSEILHRAAIAENGKLNSPFLYLSDYVTEK